MNVLEVVDVHKKLGKRNIINGISFSVKQGEIFGFLGPNGAGKTTTIRMLVGLISPDKGSISIMGHDLKKETEKALSKIGAVVENPELYTYLSGKENLMQIARIRKGSIKDVEEIITLVGLENRINDKVRKYSLGMKQRLGLAAALLSNPRLLILDEPTNGLDPSGILDFREIVKKAAQERGTSVFISSHILSEIQMLCDTVAFINDGVIKAIESIRDDSSENLEIVKLVVKNPENIEQILKSLDCIYALYQNENIFTLETKSDSTSFIIKNLTTNNIDVKEIYIEHKGLEQRYMELVEGGIR